MSTQIQLRRDIAANWIADNPTPAQGEMCVETDTGKLKIGNGVATWTGLPYYDSRFDASGSATIVLATATGRAIAFAVALGG